MKSKDLKWVSFQRFRRNNTPFFLKSDKKKKKNVFICEEMKILTKDVVVGLMFVALATDFCFFSGGFHTKVS